MVMLINDTTVVGKIKLVPTERSIVGFIALKGFFDSEIAPRISAYDADVDKQALIMGDVLLLCGGHREPGIPILRDFIKQYLPAEVSKYLIERFNQLAFSILETAEISTDGVIKVSAMGGYALAIDSMRLQRI